MKLRVQELKWQSGNQLFQIQRFTSADGGAWLAVGDCHNTLEAAINKAKAMLNPPAPPEVKETIHEIK